MTCLEKYLQIHPGVDHDDVYNCSCPHWDGLTNLEKPEYCGQFENDCEMCWNREIPGTESEEPHIRDSGSRTEFSTGAVRDIQKGKGRCDLMPLDVVAVVMGGHAGTIVKDAVIDDISLFQQTGDVKHLYYAARLFGSRGWNNIPTMLLEVSKHFEEGAEKYGENNWQKGLPVKCYINSAIRHYLKFLKGDTDEHHDRAFCWNVICAIWTCIHKPELNDYAPKKQDFDPDDLMGEYEEEND